MYTSVIIEFDVYRQWYKFGVYEFILVFLGPTVPYIYMIKIRYVSSPQLFVTNCRNAVRQKDTSTEEKNTHTHIERILFKIDICQFSI